MTVQARGIDRLPAEATTAVADSLVRSLDGAELRRAFVAVTAALVAEIERADAGFANRLTPPLRELTGQVALWAGEHGRGPGRPYPARHLTATASGGFRGQAP